MVRQESLWFGGTALLIYLALVTVIVHMLVGQRYGIHRDELATLDDARRLAWGYVAYPPVTPFFGRLSLILFGPTLPGFRLFAALAEAAALVLTGLMAREMGGGRGAQPVAAGAGPGTGRPAGRRGGAPPAGAPPPPAAPHTRAHAGRAAAARAQQ